MYEVFFILSFNFISQLLLENKKNTSVKSLNLFDKNVKLIFNCYFFQSFNLLSQQITRCLLNLIRYEIILAITSVIFRNILNLT